VAAAYASGNSHAQQRHMPYADTAHMHDAGEVQAVSAWARFRA